MISKRFWLTAVLGAALVAGASAAQEYVPGELLVKFKPEAASRRAAITAVLGAKVASETPALGVQRIVLPKGMSVEQGIRYYRGINGVAYAEPNFIVHATFVPNDARYNQQYAHPRISSPAAWDLDLGSPTIKIAIVDTGVDYNHEDLSGKVTKGHDFVNNDDDPMDDQGHGTHCAGISAAKTNNGIGVAGMGFNCSLIAVKVLNSGGSGTLDWVTKGIIDAADRGADVISVSIGGPFAQAEEDAVTYAWNKGAVVVAAAGNSNTNQKSYPGACENAIGVGASDKDDKKADFSNFGSDWVDVAAPGVNIMSTLPNNKYDYESGTSMACPLVAGLVGLMKSYSPTSTQVQLRAALEGTCDNIGTWIAKGRVNAFRAVSALVRPANKEFYVKTIGVYGGQGVNLSGRNTYLNSADTGKVTLGSVVMRNVGTVAALQADLSINVDPSNIRSSSFVFAGQSTRGATVQLYLYNYGKRQYEVVKAFSATGSYQTVEIPVSKVSNYVNGTTMSAIVRSFVSLSSRSPGYTMSVDVLKLKASVNQ